MYIFSGNYNRDTVVTHVLRRPVKGMCFRIKAVTFKEMPVLRFEVIGKRGNIITYIFIKTYFIKYAVILILINTSICAFFN